jgi:hypothetical protein
MTRKGQKLAEMKVVQLFRNAGGLDIHADLLFVPDHLERPDIIANTDGKTVGIEIRRLNNDEQEGSGSGDRKRHGVYQSVVANCSELHASRSDKWFIVRVSFSKNADIDLISRRRSGRKQKIAEMLVNLVESLVLEVGEPFDLRSEDHWGPQWPDEIVSVHGVLHEGDGPPEWEFLDNWWVDETSDEIIQNALDDKERNVMSWCDRFDEAWVLLVLDGSVGASMLRPHEQMMNNEYQSSFDRACVMEFDGKSYRELRLRRAKV